MAVVVPFFTTDWRHQNVGSDSTTGYAASAFDDSTWAVGGGAWGHNGPEANFHPFALSFPLNTYLWIRRVVTVVAGEVTVRVRVDNSTQVYWDGTLMGSGSAIRANEITPVVFAATAGSHILAVRGHDFGSTSYLDASIEAVAPVAEPGSIIRPVRNRFMLGRVR